MIYVCNGEPKRHIVPLIKRVEEREPEPMKIEKPISALRC